MKLPAYQHLSEEQDRVLNIPLDKNCLVSGAPGTGKTLIALYRAQMLRKKRNVRRTLFLVYNRTLRMYLADALEEVGLTEDEARTVISWGYSLSRKVNREAPPAPPANPRQIDWLSFLERLPDPLPAIAKVDHVVLDEAQDFDPIFFRLIKMMAPGYTIFADENQRITATNSTLEDIRKICKVDEYRLSRNYRNTAEIHDVATRYYCGLPTGKAERPTRRGQKPAVFSHRSIESQISQILRYEQTHPSHEIGVLVPRVKLVHEFVKQLRDCTNQVQFITADMPKDEIKPFRGPGVRVLAYPSAKGLEFDAVFLPCLDQVTVSKQQPDTLMQFYVLTTRARDELYLLYSRDGSERDPTALSILDDDLVVRREIP